MSARTAWRTVALKKSSRSTGRGGIQSLLSANGWKVFLTRTNDTDVALSNRVNFAEARHADLFISLHFNSAAPDTKQDGLETFCLTPAGMPSTLTRGYSDSWSTVTPTTASTSQNVQLADPYASRVDPRHAAWKTGVSNRARFIGVLRGQQRPAVLIEGGYLSNPHEAEKIESADFREKLAEAVAAALK